MIKEGEVDDHTLRMFLFVTQCVQLFSGRYKHPDASSVLESVAARSAVIRKQTLGRARDVGSTTSYSSPRIAHLQSQCAMRYGIALGPVTVGVLQGKCPVFDVWGKTVNLASRMEVSIGTSCVTIIIIIYN